MPKIARVIITMECQRHCDNCCNTYDSIMSKAVRISRIGELDGYDVVCITGGEPMLNRDRTLRIIEAERNINPDAKIYLYTALYRPSIRYVINSVDGIHYTIHHEATDRDIADFHVFQAEVMRALRYDHTKSFRLYIDSRVDSVIQIIPNIWSRVEIKPWLMESECPLPEGETLFILDESAYV